MQQLRLSVLGTPDFRRDGEVVRLRTHKALALLIFLALEPGPHGRDELAELLWPGHPDTARSALRLALHHLSGVLGAGLLTRAGRDQLEVQRSDQLWVDAQELSVQVADRSRIPDLGCLALWRGDFVQGFTVKDAPAWDDWVHARQVRCSEQFDTLLARLAHAHQLAGRNWDAMACTRRRIQHDPLNEDAYRQLAAQQTAAGLLAEAAATRQQCAEVLIRELGVRPEFAVPRPAHGPQETPQAVPEPDWASQLVGRENLLRQMDEAWDSGKPLVLVGEPGVGKSRLAEVWLAQRQLDCFRVDTHPVDADIPFSAMRLSIENCLRFLGHPDIPEGVRRELSRIVPGLHAQPPPPLGSETDRLNFYEAQIDFLAFVAQRRPTYCLFADNAQYGDRESVRMGSYAAIHGPARGVFQRTLLTFRTYIQPAHGPALVDLIREMDTGLMLTVPPLSTEQVHELLAQLDKDASSALAERIGRFTGGNPLFVLETARLLLERGGLSTPDARELPRSTRVQEVIGQRLSALSEEAQHVLRAAAVAGPDFSFDIARQLLMAGDLRLAATFEELEKSGIFRQDRFAHDLLEATALDLTPPPWRVVLHRRMLEVLRERPTAAATLARHALGGRLWPEAQDLLMQASREADALLARADAEAFRARADALRHEERTWPW